MWHKQTHARRRRREGIAKGIVSIAFFIYRRIDISRKHSAAIGAAIALHRSYTLLSTDTIQELRYIICLGYEKTELPSLASDSQ